jgi:hypothetical protein
MVVHTKLLYQAFGLIIIAFFDVYDRVGALYINGKRYLGFFFGLVAVVSGFNTTGSWKIGFCVSGCCLSGSTCVSTGSWLASISLTRLPFRGHSTGKEILHPPVQQARVLPHLHRHRRNFFFTLW